MDVVIIGGGPAALTAAIYLGEFGIKTKLVSQNLGGLLNEIFQINNYPGLRGISGQELAKKMIEHVKSYESIEIIRDYAKEIKQKNGAFEIVLEASEPLKARAVIVATGTKYRKLNIPGEKDFLGKGLGYCVLCEAMFVQGKRVAVIGSGMSALHSAIFLSNIAEKVYLISKYKEPKFPKDRVKEYPKIELLAGFTPLKFEGDERLRKIVLVDDDGKIRSIDVDHVFVNIGREPNIDVVKGLELDLDDDNRIKVNERMETSIKGIFAAGDVTNGSAKINQIITACSEGAIAAKSVIEYLKNL